MDRTFLPHIKRGKIQSKDLYLIDKVCDKIDEKTIMLPDQRFANGLKRLKDFVLSQFSPIAGNEDIIVQFFFELADSSINSFKRQTPFQFLYIQVITFDDPAAQSIRHLQRCPCSNEGVTISISSRPKTHANHLVVSIPFTGKTVFQKINYLARCSVKNILEIPNQTNGFIIWCWFVLLEKGRFS